MSAENVDVVRTVMTLLDRARTDPDAVDPLVERLDPEVRIDMSRRVFNPGVYEGHDGFRRLNRETAEAWDRFEIHPERFVDAGPDRVVVIATRHGWGKGSGVEVEDRSAAIWTIRGGLVLAMETDIEPDEALRLAGVDA
jgi:ketosteroid isomerase-like protein